MQLKRFSEFINESVNDKYALLDILREYGVYNPPEFMNYLNDLGYTIIELDPVGRGIQESFNTFDKVFEDDDEGEWEDTEEDKLNNFLISRGVKQYALDSFFNDLHKEFGFVIVKDTEWEATDDDFEPENESNINEDMDLKYKLQKRLNPTLFQRISKIGMIMMDISYHGLRTRLDIPDDDQYMHTMNFVYDGLKVLKGISKLEKWIEKKSKEHNLSTDDRTEFNEFIIRTIKELHYQYPRKFKGELTNFEQDDMDEFVNTFNQLVDKYNVGKKIYQEHENKKRK